MTDTQHVLLVLPFTASTYLHPGPLLGIIHANFLANPASSYTVLFATPEQPRRRSSAYKSAYQDVTAQPQGASEQLYVQLKRNPRANFAGMQAFLGAVYAALSGAVWASGRILTDVEVRFEGEEGIEEAMRDLTALGNVRAFGLEGYETLPVSKSLRDLLPERETIPAGPSLSSLTTFAPPPPSQGPEVVALGGTFDHLHAAHKLLIHLGAFLATRKLIIGVMADRLLKSKNHPDLLEPVDRRKERVEEFLSRCGAVKLDRGDRGNAAAGPSSGTSGRMQMDVVEIEDPYGPTAWDADIQALLVSRETASGGEAVNKLRREKGLPQLEVFTIEVIGAQLEREMTEAGSGGSATTQDLRGVVDESELKAVKMGSSGIRQWLADNNRSG